MTARGARPFSSAAAATTAQQPNSSAAGMDTVGRGVAVPQLRSSASLSALVAALRCSMRAISPGHHAQ
eukprot:6177702-Pleurochrysis_carterae.AAC.1